MLAHTSEVGHRSDLHGGHLRRRLLAVISTVAAVALIWSLVTLAAGFDLRAPAMDGRSSAAPIGLGPVVAVSTLAALAGWALLAVFERRTRRARTWWLVAALVALAISLTGPMSGTGVTGADRSLLMLLHAVVAVVLIPLMYRSSTGRPGNTDEEVRE
jgi:hypothetical protein